MAYAFEPILVIDAANPTKRAANASVAVYDSNDTANATPLALTDPNGVALANPINTTADAFTPSIMAPSGTIKLVGGGLTVIAWSGKALLDQANSAQSSAASAASWTTALMGGYVDGGNASTAFSNNYTFDGGTANG